MNSISLLFPSLIKAKRQFSSKSRLAVSLIVLAAIGVVVAIYCGLYLFFSHVGKAAILGKTIGPLVGSMLLSKLLEMILLTMMVMVFFSSIISAFTAFFLDGELEVLMASPQSVTSIFFSKFMLMTFESSWMVMLFFLPALFAFASALNASLTSYLLFPFFLLLFVIFPNFLGAFCALLVSYFFPVRQMKKVFQFLSIIVMSGMIFFLRSLEAEKLLNPSQFSNISQYLLNLQVPLTSYSPSYLMHNTTMALFKNDFSDAFVQFFPFVLISLFLVVLLNVLAYFSYKKSWQKSMEAIENQVLGLEYVRRILVFPFKKFAPEFRVIATKEITNFLRDPAIFSQTFMIVAIVFIYGYNLKVLPLEDITTLYTAEINDLLVYFTGPFIGFIIASFGMRFVYPSISLEGRAFWAVKASPLKTEKILLFKYALYVQPMCCLAIVLCFVTNSLFRVSEQFLLYLSFFNVILIAVVTTALAICVGAIHAEFDMDSPLKISASFGGLVYMLLASLFVINLVGLQIYPLYQIFFKQKNIFAVMTSQSSVLLLFLMFLSIFYWLYIPFKKGLNSIEVYEPE